MNVSKMIKNEFYFFLIVAQFLLFVSCTHSKELSVLIPYEINDKVGFVNQELKKITNAEYDNFEGKVIRIKKHCGIVIKKDDTLVQGFILLGDGSSICLWKRANKKSGSSDYFSKDFYKNACLLGDEYYSVEINASNKNFTTEIYEVKNKKKKCSLQNIRINADTNNFKFIPVYIPQDFKYNYISLDGKMIFPETNFDKYAITYPFDLEYRVARVEGTHSGDMKIVDTEGNILNGEQITLLWNFSSGMAAGWTLSKKGYFNHTGKLAIEVKELDDMPYAFHCDVLPCIFENGNIYAVNKRESKNWAIIDKTGSPIKKNIEAFSILEFSDDGVAVLIKKENEKFQYYLIDTQGNFVVTTPYDKICSSVNGYCIAKKDGIDYLISAKDGNSYKCLDFK